MPFFTRVERDQLTAHLEKKHYKQKIKANRLMYSNYFQIDQFIFLFYLNPLYIVKEFVQC